MCKFLDRITGKHKTSAKVVDGTLVLSILNSTSPVVWQWNLSDVKASALEVRNSDDEKATLVLKTPKGDVQSVAEFETQNEALKALMSVSNAMENAQGHIKSEKNIERGNNNTQTPINNQTKGENLKILGGLAAIILILGLFMWMQKITPNRLDNNIALSGAAENSSTTQDTGVPVSADDYLSGF